MDREFCFQPYEGMTVYLRPTGNLDRFWDGKLIRGTVTSVKRVYFYVDTERGSKKIPFSRKTCCNSDQDLSCGYEAYPSMEAYAKAVKKQEQWAEIRSVFTSYGEDVRNEVTAEMVDTISLILNQKVAEVKIEI